MGQCSGMTPERTGGVAGLRAGDSAAPSGSNYLHVMQNRVALAVAVAREHAFLAREGRVLSASVLTTVVEIGGVVARWPNLGSASANPSRSRRTWRQGQPCRSPARVVDPGPHYRQGMVISFWKGPHAPIPPSLASSDGDSGSSMRRWRTSRCRSPTSGIRRTGLLACLAPPLNSARPRSRCRRGTAVTWRRSHKQLHP